MAPRLFRNSCRARLNRDITVPMGKSKISRGLAAGESFHDAQQQHGPLLDRQ